MAFIKDTGTPGANNAELPIGAVLDTGAKTLSLEVGTEVQSAVVLEEKQWIVLETRNINGTANLTGECIYTEDATDLADVLTFVNDVRTRMVALHTTFDMSATHYKTGSVIDIYRGDEATVATLEVIDTDVILTPPALWGIDDLTPFAPSEIVGSVNLIVDPSFDDDAKHNIDAYSSVDDVAGKGYIDLTGTSASSAIRPDISTPLEAGVSYTVGCDVDAFTTGYYRFYLGSNSSGFTTGTGTKTSTLLCEDASDAPFIQAINECAITIDNFICERI